MAGNARFHNKFHRRGHHTDASAGYPDSGTDPIASQAEPFLGSFYIDGSLSASGDAFIDHNVFVGGDTTVIGNLSVMGDLTYLDTIVSVTSALSVINMGTGPALSVLQYGAQPIARFIDKEGTCTLLVDDNGQMGFNTCNLQPGIGITINNTISSNQALTANANVGSYHYLIGSVSEGHSQATGTDSHAEGTNTTASGNNSHAGGTATVAAGDNSLSFGADNVARAHGSIALGRKANAVHAQSLVYSNFSNYYNSSSFADNTFNVFASGGNYLFNKTTVGDPASATAFVVTSAGLVGINTSNPIVMFHMTNGDALIENGTLSATGAGVNYFAGSVGIKTNAPGEALTVSGNILTNGTLSAISPNYSSLVLRGISAVSTDPAYNLIRGRLGINTRPLSTYALHVRGGNIRVDGVDFSTVIPNAGISAYDTDGQSLFDLRSGAIGDNYSLSIAESGTGYFMKYFGGRTGDDKSFINVKSGTPLRLGTFDNFYGANYNEHMRIDRTGNVGIHINHPWVPGQYDNAASEALTVSGNISASGNLSAANVSTYGGTSNNWNSAYTTTNTNSAAWGAGGGGGDAAVNTLVHNNSGNWNSVYTTTNANSAVWVVDGGNTRNNDIKIGTNDNFNLALKTNGIDRITISNNGNVGIGNNLPGQKLTVSGNISALSAVYTIGIQPGVIPAMFKADGINLLAATGTRQLLYTVPVGMKFTASGYKLIITATDQSAAFTTGPSIALDNTTGGSQNKLINDLVLTNQYVYAVGNIINQSGGYGGGGAKRVASSDSIYATIVTPDRAGGTVTNMVASVIVIGELFY